MLISNVVAICFTVKFWQPQQAFFISHFNNLKKGFPPFYKETELQWKGSMDVKPFHGPINAIKEALF